MDKTSLYSSASWIAIDPAILRPAGKRSDVIILENEIYDLTGRIIDGLHSSGRITRKEIANQQIRYLCFCYGVIFRNLEDLTDHIFLSRLNTDGKLEDLDLVGLFILQSLRRCIKITEAYIQAYTHNNYQVIHSLSRAMVDCVAILSSFSHVSDRKKHIADFMRSNNIGKCSITTLPLNKKGNYPSFTISWLVDNYDPIDSSISEWLSRHYKETCHFAHHTPAGMYDFAKIDGLNGTINLSLDDEFTSSMASTLHIERYISVTKECCLLANKLASFSSSDVFNIETFSAYRLGLRRIRSIYGANSIPSAGHSVRLRHLRHEIKSGWLIKDSSGKSFFFEGLNPQFDFLGKL